MRRWYKFSALLGIAAAGVIAWRFHVVSVDAQRRTLEHDCLTVENADKQIAVCNNLIEHFAQSRAFGYHEVSVSLFKKADLTGALAMADKAIIAEGEVPSKSGRYSWRALIYSRINDETKAIADYSRAIELESDNAHLYVLYVRRGMSRQRNGDHGGAIADLDTAITIGPARATDYQVRASAYAALHNWNAVIEDWSKSIELLPGDAEAYFHRGSAYAELGDHEHAKKDFEQAIVLNPAFSRARDNLQRLNQHL